MTKKHILVGVTGGIAAYKACDLVSSLSKKDYDIRVILTPNATQFVSPLTFEALSHHKCETSLFDETNEDPIAHINLAQWADAFIITPCSADVLAKVVHGISDDLLTTTFLAATCPKIICPAMNVHMYENEVTQRNLTQAKQLGYHILEPVAGLLACQEYGTGKLIPVIDMVNYIDHMFEPKEAPLQGKRVLISAGPTRESLDPVRFITNHSSGKQGYAIAKAAIAMGADVTLVAGPTNLPDLPQANMVHVTTANDMFEAMKTQMDQADFIIMSAAVSDYRPEVIAEHKLKNKVEDLSIRFVKNPDILAYMGAHKKDQVICGFAMETQDLVQNAKHKLETKNCDMLIANHLFTEGAGFNTDTNVVTLFTQTSETQLPKCTKEELGTIILETMMRIKEERTC